MIDKIFLLNHKDLKDRLQIISDELHKQNITFELIQDFHPNEINSSNYSFDEYTFNNLIINTTTGTYSNFNKKITINELSLFLKHKLCFEKQVLNNYNYVLIIEDDALIPPNFEHYLMSHINEFKKNKGDVLVLGECCGLFPLVSNDSIISTDFRYKTRCTHAIIYSLDSSKKILNHLENYNLPIDFKLNEIFEVEKFTVYWSHKPIKQNKNFTSSIQI